MNKKKEDVMRRIKSISICFWNSSDTFSYNPETCGIILKAGKEGKDLLPVLLDSDIDVFLPSFLSLEVPQKDFGLKIKGKNNEETETILHRLMRKEDIHGAIIYFEDNGTLDIMVPCELDGNDSNRFHSNTVKKDTHSIVAVVANEPNIKKNFIDSIDLVFADGDFISSLALGKEVLRIDAEAGKKRIETNLFAEKKDMVSFMEMTFDSGCLASIYTRHNKAKEEENLNITLHKKEIESVIIHYRKGNEEAWFIPPPLEKNILAADGSDNLRLITVNYAPKGFNNGMLKGKELLPAL